MRIIKLRIKYPEQFQQHVNKLFLSPLHLTDKTNLINIMEIVSGLFLSKRIIYQNGKPVHLTDLGKAFEWRFNIKLGDYFQKYMDVIKRKPAKLSEFLDELANLFYISKYHMMRRFRAETGYTIHAYLTGKRLVLAREQIAAGMPVLQAAGACGFGDYSAFCRAYRRQFGQPPSSAR